MYTYTQPIARSARISQYYFNNSIKINIHEIWSVAMDDCAEGESVPEGGCHVCDLDVAVSLGDVLGPLLQTL